MSIPVFYIEFEKKAWDASLLQQAWQKVLRRHKQTIMKHAELPKTAFRIANLDCSSDSKEIAEKKQMLLRHELLNGNSSELETQGFAIKTTQTANDVLRLHVAFNAENMNGAKFSSIWREWQALYQDDQLELSTAGLQPNTDYWKKRLSGLPNSAEIVPVVVAAKAEPVAVRYQHHLGKLPAGDYRRLKVMSQKQTLSLTALLLTMIQDIVAEHVQTTDFRLNLLLGNRLPLYPYLGDKADYASSVHVLPIVATSEKTFLQRAQQLAASLREDAKHLVTASLPSLEEAEQLDAGWMPIQIECNLQQGLRQPLLPPPVDIVYYAGEDLRVKYEVSIWEQDGNICYRCSMPRGFTD